MSRAPGQVLDVRGEIAGHFEYISTVDVARPQIFATVEERDAAWREPQPEHCACQGSDVILVTAGLRWGARACFDHGFIVYGCGPFYGPEEDDACLSG